MSDEPSTSADYFEERASDTSSETSETQEVTALIEPVSVIMNLHSAQRKTIVVASV